MGKADETSKPTNQIARVRLSKNIDLSKADKRCFNCFGSGVLRLEEIKDNGKMIKVPVICSCVTRNGGVKKDAFDKILEEAQTNQIVNSFGLDMASDIIAMQGEAQASAIRQLKDLQNKDTLKKDVRKQLNEALETIRASGIDTEK